MTKSLYRSTYNSFYFQPYGLKFQETPEEDIKTYVEENFIEPMKTLDIKSHDDQFKTTALIWNCGVPNAILSVDTIIKIAKSQSLTGIRALHIGLAEFVRHSEPYWVFIPELKRIIQLPTCNPAEIPLCRYSVVPLTCCKYNSSLTPEEYLNHLKHTKPLELNDEEVEAIDLLHQYGILASGSLAYDIFCTLDGSIGMIDALTLPYLPPKRVRNVMCNLPMTTMFEAGFNYFDALELAASRGEVPQFVNDWLRKKT